MSVSKKNKILVAGMAAAAGLGFYSVLPTVREKYPYMVRNKIAWRMEKTGEMEAGKKPVFLTFDDGPGPHTMELLDLLEQYDVKATFFIVTSFAEKYPETIERMKEEGHEIGLHSYLHKSGLFASPVFTRKTFRRSLEIMNKMDVHPTLYRAPWGEINRETVRQTDRMNLKRVYWTVMAEDWRGGQSCQVTAEKLFARVHPGDVICIHDGRGKNDAPARTIEALKMVLPVWKSMGYTFETMKK